MLHHVFLEGPYLRVVPLGHRVVRPRKGGDLLGHLPALLLPLYAPTIHHPDVVVPEELEDPQRVGGPPVVLVPVEDDRRVRGYALLAHEPGEVLGVQVIAHEGIVEILYPVYLHRVGDVPYIVEEYVLVALDDPHIW